MQGNYFFEDASSWLGKFVNLSGNHFLYQNEKGAILAFVLGYRAIFDGGMSYLSPQTDFTDYTIEQLTNDYRETSSFVRIT